MASRDNTPARPVRHSRDDVANAALRILDEYGLADLTMRRLGAELEVQASALYWHFPNKQTLLAELSDRIIDRAATEVSDLTTAWDSRTRATALALRDALLSYRDGAELVSSTRALGLGANTAHTLLRRSFDDSGCDPVLAHQAATALLHFVLGQVSYEQQRMQFDSLGVAAAEEGVTDAGASDTGASVMVGADAAEGFSVGVSLLIEGLRTMAFDNRSGGERETLASNSL